MKYLYIRHKKPQRRQERSHGCQCRSRKITIGKERTSQEKEKKREKRKRERERKREGEKMGESRERAKTWPADSQSQKGITPGRGDGPHTPGKGIGKRTSRNVTRNG